MNGATFLYIAALLIIVKILFFPFTITTIVHVKQVQPPEAASFTVKPNVPFNI